MEEKEKEKGREERKKGEKEKEKGREERKKEEKERKREGKERKRRENTARQWWFFFFLLNNDQVDPFRGNPLSGQRNPFKGGGCHKTPLVVLFSDLKKDYKGCPHKKKTRFL